jgi:hypothetical protein
MVGEHMYPGAFLSLTGAEAGNVRQQGFLAMDAAQKRVFLNDFVDGVLLLIRKPSA